MGTYLGCWPLGGELYPRRLETDEGRDICGVCQEWPAAWGDWMCSRCRAELEASLQLDMDTDEESDAGVRSRKD